MGMPRLAAPEHQRGLAIILVRPQVEKSRHQRRQNEAGWEKGDGSEHDPLMGTRELGVVQNMGYHRLVGNDKGTGSIEV